MSMKSLVLALVAAVAAQSAHAFTPKRGSEIATQVFGSTVVQTMIAGAKASVDSLRRAKLTADVRDLLAASRRRAEASR